MRFANSSRSTSFSSWLLAAIIFIAVLTFTNKDVVGIGTPTTTIDTTKLSHNFQSQSEELSYASNEPLTDPGTPGGVPEPATLLLLGTGLGAAWMLRRKTR